MTDYTETGAELYLAGRTARARDVKRDSSQPRPWLLGWEDEDRSLNALAVSLEAFGVPPNAIAAQEHHGQHIAAPVMMDVCTQNQKPPAELLRSLEEAQLHYSTNPKAIYYCIPVYTEGFCGVFGDGANGCYEWFIWNRGELQHSDSAYGMQEAPLRDVLTNVFGPPSSQAE